MKRWCVVGVAVGVLACAGQPDADDAPAAEQSAPESVEPITFPDSADFDPALAGSPLEGTVWLAVSVFDTPVPLGAEATLRLDRELDRAAGSTGCNGYSGSYELTGTLLRLHALAFTRLACPEDLIQLEVDIIEAFRVTGSFRLRGDELDLMGSEGPVATFVATVGR